MSDFKILSDSQHILTRPAMYIGSVNTEPLSGIIEGIYQTVTVVPGLLKIINEILDNSVDEFVRTKGEYANKIEVDIEQLKNSADWEIRIKDNGRGIPIVKHGEDDSTYQPVLAWTKARAGSNFGEDRVTLGANGVGSFCTNVFSKSFIGITSNGSQTLKMVCENNSEIKSVKVTESNKQGTEVKFVPELSRFSITTITDDHLKMVKDRLENLMVCYPGLTFVFNGEKIKFRSNKDFAARFSEHNVLSADDNNLLIFAPSGKEEEFRLITYVNGLWIKNGGSHVDYILDQVIANLREFVKKKHKIDVLPNQIKSHLLLGVYSRNFSNLKFDSQTKERITNSRKEVEDQYASFNFDKISKQILNTPEIIDPIISALLYKKEREEAAALAKANKNIQKKRVINHIAATSNNPAEKILFLAEGNSAIGSLISVRDPKKIGGYPLRGKVMNVRGMKPTDILKNKEISELMSITNLTYGQKAEKLSYGKIAILTDADTDGASIACLLLNLFSEWPELFTNGHIYKCETPLYICAKGKDVKWFYTQEEYDNFDTKGYTVDYIKGLGTLPKAVYKEVINNPKLVQITADELSDFDKLEMAFGSNAELRKEWMAQ
jgi:DNA topoisomerase-2